MGRAGRFGQPAAPAAAAGATDHGALTGLGDDDHPQYASDTDLSTHAVDTTAIHGITDTAALETGTGATAKVAAHTGAADPHGDRAAAASALATHEADTTAIHGIADTSALETTTGSAAKVSTHAAAADPHTGYQKESEKDAASGYAGLSAGAKLAASQLPNPSSSTLGGVQSKAAAANQFLTQIGTDGVVAAARPVAADVTFTPVGAIAATDVQAAIAELLAERETMVLFSKQGVVAVTTEGDTPPPFRWYNRTGRTLTFLVASANATIGPSGSTMTVDVNVDGTTIMTGTKVVLPNNSGAASAVAQTTFSTATVDDGHYISVNVDTNGGGAVQNLMVQILLKG